MSLLKGKLGGSKERGIPVLHSALFLYTSRSSPWSIYFELGNILLTFMARMLSIVFLGYNGYHNKLNGGSGEYATLIQIVISF